MIVFQVFSQIGYIPQNDALINSLSGRSTLNMFARLRGIQGNKRKQIVNNWIDAIGTSFRSSYIVISPNLMQNKHWLILPRIHRKCNVAIQDYC